MATVHTAYGPGEVVETKTVRGRTDYRVAGNDFDIWLDETKVAGVGPFDGGPGGLDGNFPHPRDRSIYTPEVDQYADDWHPSDAYGDLSKPYPEDTDYDEFDGGRAGEIFNNAPSSFGRSVEETSQDAHQFGPEHGMYAEGDPAFWDDIERNNPDHNPHLGFAPVDHDNSVDLPYNPEPQYGVGPLSESTIQPVHEIDADERTSPADSLTFEDRETDEGDPDHGPGPNSDLFAKASALGDYPRGAGGIEAGPDEAHAHWMDQNQGQAWEHESPYYQGETPSADFSRAQHPGYGGPTGPQDSLEHTDAFQNYQEGENPYDYSTEGGPGAEPMTQDAEPFYHAYRTADVLEGKPINLGPHFIVNDTDDEFLQDVDVEEDERETTGPDGIVHFASRHEANPLAIALPALAEAAGGAAGAGEAGAVGRALGAGGGGGGADPLKQVKDLSDKKDPLPLPDLGQGWGYLTQLNGSVSRPENLDARYADIIASHDPNDPVSMFRHDPEAYINRVGHVEFEGLDPRMASYIDLVDGDAQIREAAWRDVREKAMRLRREGRVHVKDVDYDRIYASVEGDHGTYDVMIKKGGDFGGLGGGHSITNWHCACEWGKWAFQRRFTFVGRLCSHGYASYLELQSKHLKGKKRQTKPSGRYYASDETTQDWKAKDTGEARGALEDLRDWAEQPHETWNGNQAEHVDDVQDAVQEARDAGVDADQLVASLHRVAYPDPQDDPLYGRGGPGNPNALGDNDPKYKQTDPMSAYPQDAGPGGRQRADASDPSAYSKGHGVTAPGGLPVGSGSQAGGVGPAGPSRGDAQPAQSATAVPGTHAPGSFGEQMSHGGEIARSQTAPNGTPGSDTPAGAGQAWQQNTDKTPISGGDYKVTQGDTLSDIAQRSGYGSDYNSLAQQNKISDPNKIDVGQSIKIAPPAGAGGAASGAAEGLKDFADAPGAADTKDFADAPGSGSASQDHNTRGTSGGGSGDWMGSSSSPTGEHAPGTGAASAGAGAVADTSAISGGSSSGGAVDTGAAASAASSGQDHNTSSGGGLVGDAGVGATSTDKKTSRLELISYHELEADRDWIQAAYPDWVDHKPFEGSGGVNITEWGQSKDNVKSNYSDDREDVTKEPKKTHLEDLDSLEKARVSNHTAGIQRAGNGPQRAPVAPEVVRERKGRGQVSEAAVGAVEDDYDPLAPRTAASFDDPYEEVAAHNAAVMAAANGNDVVAQFQRNAANSALASDAGGGSQYDDFSSSPVFQRAMQRTAGRNYSLAEQHELMREGDIGGAGNLHKLDLRNTHYEAENSVGLW